MFAWSYKDLKDVPPKIKMRHIDLIEVAKPVKQSPYRMNPKYKKRVKVELDKVLELGYINEIDYSDWLSPVAVAPNKNWKIRVCVDYWQLNKVTKKDPYPIPFVQDLLEMVGGQEVYSFTDGFNGYN